VGPRVTSGRSHEGVSGVGRGWRLMRGWVGFLGGKLEPGIIEAVLCMGGGGGETEEELTTIIMISCQYISNNKNKKEPSNLYLLVG
jgi:hypothetical protein